MSLKKLLSNRDWVFFILVVLLNLLLIIFVYQSAFKLELEGDSWQYAWAHQIEYGSNVFGTKSLAGMRSSLGGASLTFGLIQNHFGLSAVIYYAISVALKFLTVIVFYLLVKRITANNFASFIATLILSVTFAGVEATHWVFNMYAYIGLIFIMLSVIVGLDLPVRYNFKKWLISFGLACAGIWYATMRTNGIILVIIGWSFYKLLTLRSKSSRLNLISWIIGFIIFILIDKFLLGQMESDYSQKHIIEAGLRAIQTQIAYSKYDFIFSPAANLGSIILPDVTWISLNFPKLFSFIGGSVFHSVILPSFLIFTLIAWITSKLIAQGRKLNSWIPPKFLLLFSLGLYWTGFVFFILTLGSANFPSWVTLVLSLFGGYFMIFCLFFLIVKEVPSNLKDLFFLSFLWSFVFLLLPEFQNGGPLLGTYQRYMVTTAPAVPLFVAGLIVLSSIYKNNLFRILTLIIVTAIFFSHATATKTFFDRKAQVHNRQLSAKIWQQFMRVVPNKAQYIKNDDPNVDLTGIGRAPTLWFESAENPLDQETLFESLYFGFGFQTSLRYNWYIHSGMGLYYRDYPSLIRDIKENQKKLDDFYAVRLENQSLTDITQKMKEKISEDIQK